MPKFGQLTSQLNGMPYKGDEQHVLVVRIADSNVSASHLVTVSSDWQEQKEYKQRTQRMLNGLASSSTPSLGRDGSHRLSTSDLWVPDPKGMRENADGKPGYRC
jgi:hypothetical protein